MKNLAAAAAIALGAAFLFALASVLQQRAAAEVPDEEAAGAGIIGRLIHRPLWVVGLGSDSLGYVAQAIALAIGSLIVVQPLLVATLLFALPLGIVITHRTVLPSDWLWAVVLTVALGVFLDAGNPTEGVDRAPLSSWLAILIVLGVASVAAIVAASRAHGMLRAVLLAVTTGTLFGLGSALTKSVMDNFDDGVGEAIVPLLTSWETYVLAASLAVGFVLQQQAYQAGSLTASLPAMIVLDPLVSVGIGVLVLQEQLQPGSSIGWVLIAGALVAALVATVQLARSSAEHDLPPA